MFVIKVGDYYVKDVNVEFGGFIGDITLSKERMRNFKEEGAQRVAKLVNGEVITMEEVETFDEESI